MIKNILLMDSPIAVHIMLDKVISQNFADLKLIKVDDWFQIESAVNEHEPVAVFIDGKNGYENAGRYAGIIKSKKLPVFMSLSLKDSTVSKSEFLFGMANEIFVKPFESSKVISAIKKHLHISPHTFDYKNNLPDSFEKNIVDESFIEINQSNTFLKNLAEVNLPDAKTSEQSFTEDSLPPQEITVADNDIVRMVFDDDITDTDPQTKSSFPIDEIGIIDSEDSDPLDSEIDADLEDIKIDNLTEDEIVSDAETQLHENEEEIGETVEVSEQDIGFNRTDDYPDFSPESIFKKKEEEVEYGNESPDFKLTDEELPKSKILHFSEVDLFDALDKSPIIVSKTKKPTEDAAIRGNLKINTSDYQYEETGEGDSSEDSDTSVDEGIKDKPILIETKEDELIPAENIEANDYEEFNITDSVDVADTSIDPGIIRSNDELLKFESDESLLRTVNDEFEELIISEKFKGKASEEDSHVPETESIDDNLSGRDENDILTELEVKIPIEELQEMEDAVAEIAGNEPVDDTEFYEIDDSVQDDLSEQVESNLNELNTKDNDDSDTKEEQHSDVSDFEIEDDINLDSFEAIIADDLYKGSVEDATDKPGDIPEEFDEVSVEEETNTKTEDTTELSGEALKSFDTDAVEEETDTKTEDTTELSGDALESFDTGAVEEEADDKIEDTTVLSGEELESFDTDAVEEAADNTIEDTTELSGEELESFDTDAIEEEADDKINDTTELLGEELESFDTDAVEEEADDKNEDTTELSGEELESFDTDAVEEETDKKIENDWPLSETMGNEGISHDTDVLMSDEEPLDTDEDVFYEVEELIKEKSSDSVTSKAKPVYAVEDKKKSSVTVTSNIKQVNAVPEEDANINKTIIEVNDFGTDKNLFEEVPVTQNETDNLKDREEITDATELGEGEAVMKSDNIDNQSDIPSDPSKTDDETIKHTTTNEKEFRSDLHEQPDETDEKETDQSLKFAVDAGDIHADEKQISNETTDGRMVPSYDDVISSEQSTQTIKEDSFEQEIPVQDIENADKFTVDEEINTEQVHAQDEKHSDVSIPDDDTLKAGSKILNPYSDFDDDENDSISDLILDSITTERPTEEGSENGDATDSSQTETKVATEYFEDKYLIVDLKSKSKIEMPLKDEAGTQKKPEISSIYTSTVSIDRELQSDIPKDKEIEGDNNNKISDSLEENKLFQTVEFDHKSTDDEQADSTENITTDSTDKPNTSDPGMTSTNNSSLNIQFNDNELEEIELTDQQQEDSSATNTEQKDKSETGAQSFQNKNYGGGDTPSDRTLSDLKDDSKDILTSNESVQPFLTDLELDNIQSSYLGEDVLSSITGISDIHENMKMFDQEESNEIKEPPESKPKVENKDNPDSKENIRNRINNLRQVTMNTLSEIDELEKSISKD